MNWDEWQPIAAVLSAGVGKSWDKQQVRVWFRILKDLTPEAVQAAVLAYLAEAEFAGFPPPGAIRKRAVTLLATAGGPQSAPGAWEHALQAARQCSEYDADRTFKAMDSLDPITRRVLNSIGGWRALMGTAGLPIVRGQFLKAWEAAIAAESSRPLLPAPAEAKRIAAKQRQLKLTADPAAIKLAGAIKAG